MLGKNNSKSSFNVTNGKLVECATDGSTTIEKNSFVKIGQSETVLGSYKDKSKIIDAVTISGNEVFDTHIESNVLYCGKATITSSDITLGTQLSLNSSIGFSIYNTSQVQHITGDYYLVISTTYSSSYGVWHYCYVVNCTSSSVTKISTASNIFSGASTSYYLNTFKITDNVFVISNGNYLIGIQINDDFSITVGTSLSVSSRCNRCAIDSDNNIYGLYYDSSDRGQTAHRITIYKYVIDTSTLTITQDSKYDPPMESSAGYIVMSETSNGSFNYVLSSSTDVTSYEYSYMTLGNITFSGGSYTTSDVITINTGRSFAANTMQIFKISEKLALLSATSGTDKYKSVYWINWEDFTITPNIGCWATSYGYNSNMHKVNAGILYGEYIYYGSSYFSEALVINAPEVIKEADSSCDGILVTNVDSSSTTGKVWVLDN